MKLRTSLLGCLALLLVAGLASAQVVTTGTIVLIVEDAGGGRLPGAIVSARSADSVSTRETTSDARGEAKLLALNPSAAYVVTVSMAGFKTINQERILVRSGNTITLRIGRRDRTSLWT